MNAIRWLFFKCCENKVGEKDCHPLACAIKVLLMKDAALQIERNIPLPETRGRHSSRYRDVVAKMKVGDSFVAPESIRNGISGIAKRCGVVLTVRKLKDGEIRVWLVSKTRLPKAQ